MYGEASRAGLTTAEHARLDRARRRLADIMGFYIHSAVFVAVLLGLLGLNWAMDDEWWVQWVFVGWGIGVIAHAVAVFGKIPASIRHWEQRKVREYMRSS